MFINKPIFNFFLLIFFSSIVATPLILLQEKVHQNVLYSANFIVFGLAFFLLSHFFIERQKAEILFKAFFLKDLLVPTFVIWSIIILFEFPLYFYFKIKNDSTDYFLIFGALILAPIIEEFIFRVFLFKRLLSKYSLKFSFALVTILFGLTHVNVMQILFALVIGSFLSLLFYKFENYLMNVFLHSFANLLGIIMIYILNNFNSNVPVVIAINIVIFLLVFFKFKMKERVIIFFNL
ncbi:hypothetical protein B0A56_02240 [Flavobacterium columnare NBRC 100251 = ATCC 23463]|nr:hypothetical protein B0A56_02240 [Flavobacterium columnare NBRC 100251 = ATCC 23463]